MQLPGVAIAILNCERHTLIRTNVRLATHIRQEVLIHVIREEAAKYQPFLDILTVQRSYRLLTFLRPHG